MKCRSCKHDHADFGLSAGVPCARVLRLAEARGAQVANAVANEPQQVANSTTAVANRRGTYADAEKRRVYMRELMRARRAKLKEEHGNNHPDPLPGR